MKRFLVCLLLLGGCAVPTRVGEQIVAPSIAAAHPLREMIVYVPQSDDSAAAWLKWFAKYPNLRMVIAMSPRFQHVTKDLHFKIPIQSLVKEGRLDLVLQIPNAPILPLLVEDPPYGYPDDVIQLVAQSKAGFFKQWNMLPHGLVLPYGATSPKLISLLEKLGFTWVVGALEAPAADGPYKSGPLLVWDATPSGKPSGTVVKVWDERQMKDHPLDAWLAEIKEKGGVFLLPQDPGVDNVPLDAKVSYKARTWTDPDWSMWIGQPAKNVAWSALRRARAALEAYKNSGQASVQKLDVAFEEIYSAQNSNYFASMGTSSVSPVLAEERDHEFQATLVAAYRVIGQAPPDDLFNSSTSGLPSSVRLSSTSVRSESFADGKEHIVIEEAVGDSLLAGGPDLKSLDVSASTDAVRWTVTFASTVTATADIYVDLNGQPNAGTPTFLEGRPYGTSPSDAWEYALSLSGQTATLYRTQGASGYGVVQTFPVVAQGTSYQVIIPRDIMRGSPKRWGYQVLIMSGTMLADFIDPLDLSQKDLWQDLSSGKRSDIPFIRVKSSR